MSSPSSSSFLNVDEPELRKKVRKKSPVSKRSYSHRTLFKPHLRRMKSSGYPFSLESRSKTNLSKQLFPLQDGDHESLSMPFAPEVWASSFKAQSPDVQRSALSKLVSCCELWQIHHVLDLIQPHLQRDFLRLLPPEIGIHILSHLGAEDLLNAGRVSHHWRELASSECLWKVQCAQFTTNFDGTRPKTGTSGAFPDFKGPLSPKQIFLYQKRVEQAWAKRPLLNPMILRAHEDHVITCLEFDGKWIVSGSDDHTLRVWDAETGLVHRVLQGHQGGVWCSQLSGNTLVSGSTDRTIRVWNVETGQLLFTLSGHTSTVRCLCLRGNNIVSGSRDASVRLWDVTTGLCKRVFVGHQAAVRCVQMEGNRIVSGAYDQTIRIWDADTGVALFNLAGHTHRVYSLLFDGRYVISGSLDATIRVWDAKTGQQIHVLVGHQSLTSGLELATPNLLVSANADSFVKVWDLTTGECVFTLAGAQKHGSAVTSLQVVGRYVVTSSDDGTVKLWDWRAKGEFVRNLCELESAGRGGVVWRLGATNTRLVCAVGSRNGVEDTKLIVLDFGTKVPEIVKSQEQDVSCQASDEMALEASGSAATSELLDSNSQDLQPPEQQEQQQQNQTPFEGGNTGQK